MTNGEVLRRWRDGGDRKTGAIERLREGKRGKEPRVRSQSESAPAPTRDCERNAGASSSTQRPAPPNNTEPQLRSTQHNPLHPRHSLVLPLQHMAPISRERGTGGERGRRGRRRRQTLERVRKYRGRWETERVEGQSAQV